MMQNSKNSKDEDLYPHLLGNHKSTLYIPPHEILRDFEKFFAYSGGVVHPRLRDSNNRPVRVLKPAPYQTKFANMQRAVMLKNNKAGITMSESINTFRTRILPEHAGFDALLVGQNQLMADQHLLDLKKWVINSPTVSNYIIVRPDKRFRLPEEKSKMTQMYIENPYEPDKPSRIISIGFSESLAYSWKNIDHLQISDPAMNTRKNQLAFFSGLYSRLSNTEGQIKIEGVAGERSGYFWELCRKLFKLEDAAEDEADVLDPDRGQELELEELKIMSRFDKMLITADDSVKAGIISTEWLAYMKDILPESEYRRIYYCEFSKQIGSIFEPIQTGTHEALGIENL